MTLMIGTGPFGQDPAGKFNFDMPRSSGIIYFEDCPRRIRALLGEQTIVDSYSTKLLHEQGHLPVYYFPRVDVQMGLLEESDHRTHCPFKGQARYWSIRSGDHVAQNAAWNYPAPVEGVDRLADYIAFYWNKLDQWFEEDEPAIVHPRDPYHRVDVLDTTRKVVVSLAGTELAQTDRARVLFETGLPARWYIPRADVRMDLLIATETHTGCAYKGWASYFSVKDGGDHRDIAWTYPDPLLDGNRIRDYICFFNERVDLTIDGLQQRSPQTQWS